MDFKVCCKGMLLTCSRPIEIGEVGMVAVDYRYADHFKQRSWLEHGGCSYEVYIIVLAFTSNSLIFQRVAYIRVLSSQFHQQLPHCHSSLLLSSLKPTQIYVLNPLPNTMLQHIPSPQSTSTPVPDTAMKSHAFFAAHVCSAVKDIVIVEHNISWLHLHSDLSRDALCEWIGVSLHLSPGSFVAGRYDDQTVVFVQSKIPLSRPGGLPETVEFLFSGCCGWDIISVPSEFEVSI